MRLDAAFLLAHPTPREPITRYPGDQHLREHFLHGEHLLRCAVPSCGHIREVLVFLFYARPQQGAAARQLPLARQAGLDAGCSGMQRYAAVITFR